MKVDFKRPILNLNGKTIKTNEGADWTLGDAAITALDGKQPAAGEKLERLDGKEKHRRGFLQDRIFRAAEPIELDSDEIALIKEMIGQSFGPRVVFQAWEILEGRK